MVPFSYDGIEYLATNGAPMPRRKARRRLHTVALRADCTSLRFR